MTAPRVVHHIYIGVEEMSQENKAKQNVERACCGSDAHVIASPKHNNSQKICARMILVATQPSFLSVG